MASMKEKEIKKMIDMRQHAQVYPQSRELCYKSMEDHGTEAIALIKNTEQVGLNLVEKVASPWLQSPFYPLV